MARLEYRGPDGAVARIYHAMGGSPISDLAADIFTGKSRPVTPDSIDEFELEEPAPDVRAASLARYVAHDLEDASMFTPDDALNVRARLRPMEDSRFHPYVIDGMDRALDAEFKAVAALENDLSASNVQRGGKATILLSGETCSSCEYALKAAARHYDIDIHLVRMMPTTSPAESNRLIKEGIARWRGARLVDPATGRPLLAADALGSLREGQVRQAITPAAMKRRFANIPWEPRTFRLEPAGESGAGPSTGATKPPPGC
ncbi:hypothetical protein L2Y96_02475 [Luteibacter aegosomaticola]|uniref:hypothetical protein n=1 Tax=Luteibacter aegosomaticola TaxID=2911538 RepID=UPI001FF86E4B|nr:hypothetical protein [Luteibacter aegosomaticola]UPG90658.1 hypothetical protein L2Y96_02475 [Luteibacter aegosomaticola]